MINCKKQLKVLFFGLGSIGKIHAGIIKDNYDFEISAYRSKLGQEENDLNILEYFNLENAFSIKPNIAFITNPTYLHVETALECAKRNINLFIEKPISNSLEKLDELDNEIKKRKLFTYVAYNLRFHPVIVNLKNIIKQNKKPIYFRAICSSFLPRWRSKQNYNKSYSAKKELGGGVILDLSHEFDYIHWLFGDIRKLEGYCDKISSLDIDSEDFIDAQITCNQNIIGHIHLDYFSRINERKIKIYYNDKFVEGDLIQNYIKIIDENDKEKINFYKCYQEETYKKQIQYFFEQYFNNNQNIMNNFSEALKIFRIILKFRKKYCNIY
jgi:predicted dehydrogenase